MTGLPFPVVSGHHRLIGRWSLDLPTPFYRRIEDRNLVLWRTEPSRVTLWIAVWGSSGEPKERTREWIVADSSPAAGVIEWGTEQVLGYGHVTREREENEEVYSLNAFTIADDGYLQMSVYCDQEADLALAEQLWRSVQYAPEAEG